jgi:hypothetical protein
MGVLVRLRTRNAAGKRMRCVLYFQIHYSESCHIKYREQARSWSTTETLDIDCINHVRTPDGSVDLWTS